MLYLWMSEHAKASADGTRVDQTFRWHTSNSSSEKDQSHQNLEHWQTAKGWDALLAATAHENIKDVMVFFPTASTQMLRQTMSRAQLRQIGENGVRYLLEEYTLTPIDQLDIRHQHHANTLTLIAKPQQEVAELLASFGLTPWLVVGALPDFLLLPLATSGATLFLDDTNKVLRIDESFAVSADNLDVTLSHLNHITQIQVVGNLSDEDRLILDSHKNTAGLDWQLLDRPISSIFSAETISRKHPYNLVKQTKESSIPTYWKVVAAVLVAAIAVQMLYDVLSIWRYHSIAVATKAQSEEQYREWFPDEKRIVNLKQQMQGHINRLGVVDMTALSMISRVGPALSEANLTAQKIQYAKSGGVGELELQINAPNLEALESLRTQIETSGLVAALGSVNAAEKKEGDAAGQVSGTIQVKL
jgi:general secretion pathway protein L